MELISSNSTDIQKYYEGSYVKFNELGDRLFLINRVSRECVNFLDSNNDEGIIYLHDTCPYTLSMVLPNKAMYQMGDMAYLLQRIPARQYHRGITAQNCAIKRLTGSGWGGVQVGFDTLRGYVDKPIYRQLDTILEDRMEGSEAINSRFAYHAITRKIFCDTKPIATVNTMLKIIACDSLLIPEMERFLLHGSTDTTYKLLGV